MMRNETNETKDVKKHPITSIYIKPSRRKCSVSEYKCFDIYDQDMNKIDIPDCDVIDIAIEKVDFGSIMMEIGRDNGMIHIWSHRDLDFEPIINTFIIHCKGKGE